MRSFAAFLLSVSGLLAQVIPGRYVVELSAPPLGSWARAANRNSPIASARRSQIRVEQGRVRLWVEQHRGRVLDSLDAVMNGMAVELPESEAAGLAANAAHVYPVTMAYAVLDHALPLHGIPQAWNAVGGPDHAGEGIKIGIVDTGISPDHAAFQDSALRPPAGYPLFSKPENRAMTSNKIIVARNYEQFYNLRGQSDDARDRYGHGTATATCAAGVANNGPFARISGVAPKAWIGAYKISPLNSGTASSDAILKAFDDTLADGMDVVNLSFSSPFATPVDQNILDIGVDRLTQLGVIVVVSAGNSGPDLATISDIGSVSSAISVGASDPDRTLTAGVSVTGAGPFQAVSGTGPTPDQPLSAPVADFRQIQPVGTLCDRQADGGFSGLILLTTPGACLFETQLNNAEAGGAVAVIFSTISVQEAPFLIGAGQAKLPAVSLGFPDANQIRGAMAGGQRLPGRINFGGIAFPSDPLGLLGFSSRGPTYYYGIKPDLAATGYVYTGTQKIDEAGGLYDKSGYVVTRGTSFSAPIVAGGAAVLKAARPGLTVAQYRSLLINNAVPMLMKNGAVEHVQRTGAGVLSLPAALDAGIVSLPASLSFGIGPGALDDQLAFTLTNVGKRADTFTITAVRYDEAPAPRFGDDPRGNGSAVLTTIRLAPGQSKTLYAFWRFADLAEGEYEGVIQVTAAESTRPIFIPYWYGVPAGAPTTVTVVTAVPPQAVTGASFSVFFRVIDSAGIATADPDALRFRGATVSGGGSVGALQRSTLYPNLVFAVFTMGADPGQNIFRVTFGNLAPRTFVVTGSRAGQ